MAVAIVTLTAPVLAASGIDRPQVAGGVAVETGQFPFLVQVFSARSRCTGTLIRNRWVLTAAHCALDGEPMYVRIGDANSGVDGPGHIVVDLPVRRWIPHPRYDLDGPVNQLDDIALIQLAEDATSNPPRLDGVPQYTPMPIGLATEPVTTTDELGEVSIAGFGRTDLGATQPFALWADHVPTIASRRCSHRINSTYQLCFGTYPNVCSGDSGGPVFKEEEGQSVQFGVVSFGGVATCGLSTTNSVATYVPTYREWLEDTIMTFSDRPAGSIVVGWELPPPSSDGVASGVSNAQGWAFSPGATIASVKLFVDGQKEATLPCCSERGDVQEAMANAPLLSGFSGVLNWGRLSAGEHEMLLVVKDSLGQEKKSVRTVRTIKILRETNFVRDLSSRFASCEFESTDAFECSGLEFASGSCEGPVKFRWSNGKQAFEVIEGCR